MNKIEFTVTGNLMPRIHQRLAEEETPYEAIVSTVSKGVRRLTIITDPKNFAHFKKLVCND